MRSALAICWRMSADGLRRPRSIWLRYGFEIPAISLSLRSEMRPTWRWSRMNAPTSAQRSSRSLMGRVMPSLQERFDRRLAGLVAPGDLGLQRVDGGEQRAPLG